VAAAAYGVVPAPAARAQVIVRASDAVYLRFGIQLQVWGDETQDPVSGGYSQNIFFRRVRFMVAGQVAPDVTFFVETESPRLGNAGTGTTTPTKNASSGFSLQDVLAEWRIAGDRAILGAGFFIPPASRNILTGSGALLSLDNSAFSLQANALTGSNAGRDFGLQLKGYLAGDHLEYRAGVFDGQRQPTIGGAAGSRNSPRFAARLQYDVFDPEKGYVYPGTSLGARRILALGAWGEAQGDYRAGGADVALDYPVAGRSTVTAAAQYCVFDGGRQFTQTTGGVTTPLLPTQAVFFSEAGYYFEAAKIQPFVRYERLDFSDDAFRFQDQVRTGGGVNYYVASHNMKATAFYERLQPRNAAAGATRKNTNHFVVQLQFLYF
jgi:hypothetical protein